MESILGSLERELKKIFTVEKGLVKLSYILSKIDISSITHNIEHKHPKFSKNSLIQLYLYKRTKGITTYAELCKEIQGEESKLGLTEIPSKRCLNEFVQRKADKVLLDKITELILRLATQNKVVLDIKLVQKALKKKKNNRFQKEMRSAVRLIKRLVYPVIDLKIHHNAKFSTRDLLDVLVHVSQTNDFCNNGCMTFEELNPNKKVPSGDTMMYHFNKFESLDDIKNIFERIFDVIFNFAKKEYAILNERKVDLAIDIHKIPFYGDKSVSYLCSGKHERGTTQFFEFLTCAIVVAGRRFTLDVIPKHPLDNLCDLVKEIIQRSKRKVRINRCYLDRGFDSAKIINVLKSCNVYFLMPKVRTARVKQWFDKAEGTKARVINNFEFGSSTGTATANLILVDDKEGIKRAFITNMNISEQMAHYLFRWYGRRWGIETGYRNMDKDFKPRTTSRNYHIRLFYFLFSVSLYNLWVLVNICISIEIYGKISEKPLITAKMFAIVLYRAYVDSG